MLSSSDAGFRGDKLRASGDGLTLCAIVGIEPGAVLRSPGALDLVGVKPCLEETLPSLGLMVTVVLSFVLTLCWSVKT